MDTVSQLTPMFADQPTIMMLLVSPAFHGTVAAVFPLTGAKRPLVTEFVASKPDDFHPWLFICAMVVGVAS